MMARRCSHCGHNGHNSRTCPDRGIRLFGVRLGGGGGGGGAIRKSASTSNLNGNEQSEFGDGYVSDGGLVQNSAKKGVPWSEDEHRLFLFGLDKLGKGDWRGISRHFVTSRTPTQVASHAQKYFIRQRNMNKRKRRSSLFDITQDHHQEQFSKIPPPPLPLAPDSGVSLCLTPSPPSPPPRTKIEISAANDSSDLTRLSLGISSSAAAAPPSPRISAFHEITVSG